jgi:ESS family glutamate:Na+ symporter
VESTGAISLQLFLVLSLMGLRLWAIGRAIAPLLLNTALQIGLAGAIAMVLLYRLLGKDYDAAVTAGGFMGFGLASMPVAFATMEEVTAVHGPSPRAFLLITVVGSFFVDLANATITKLFLLLPIFR